MAPRIALLLERARTPLEEPVAAVANELASGVREVQPTLTGDEVLEELGLLE